MAQGPKSPGATPGPWWVVTPTRFKELSLGDFNGFYQFMNDGSQVGPQYATKAEALADLDRYAAQFGCEGAGEDPCLLMADRLAVIIERDALRAALQRMEVRFRKAPTCDTDRLDEISALEEARAALRAGKGEA